MTEPAATSHEYMVHLAIRLTAAPDNPQTVVDEFIDRLACNGLKDWVFRVENEMTSVVNYHDGLGNVVDIDKLDGDGDGDEAEDPYAADTEAGPRPAAECQSRMTPTPTSSLGNELNDDG